MKLAKYRDAKGESRVGLVESDRLRPLKRGTNLSAIFSASQPAEAAITAVEEGPETIDFNLAVLLAPLDDQEVWGAGVTYQRSKEAREEESERAATFYDQVYRADRPELFFKSTPSRVVGPRAAIRVRADSTWTVPEPEVALVLTADLKLVGYTIGNDVTRGTSKGETRFICLRQKYTTPVGAWAFDRACRRDAAERTPRHRFDDRPRGFDRVRRLDDSGEDARKLRRPHRLVGPRQRLSQRRYPVDRDGYRAAGRLHLEKRR